MKKIVFIFLVFSLFVTSCGSKNTSDTSKKNDKNLKIEEKNIGELVVKMYEYANKYDYENMKKYFNGSINRSSETLKEYIDNNTKNGTIKNVEVLYQNTEYESGIVRIKKTFSDKTTETKGVKLEKESGEWLIIFNEFESDYYPLPEANIIEGCWYNDEHLALILNTDAGYNIVKFNEYKKYNTGNDNLESEDIYSRKTDGDTILEGVWKSARGYEITITLKDKLYRMNDGKYYYVGIYCKDNDMFYYIDSQNTETDINKSNYETIELKDFYELAEWSTEHSYLGNLEYDEKNEIIEGYKKSSMDISDFIKD